MHKYQVLLEISGITIRLPFESVRVLSWDQMDEIGRDLTEHVKNADYLYTEEVPSGR